ncbi:non-ribosomal peptide synthetase [Francisella sciaenopsi]|uniref:Carrier domain-containing protein n=1 Tax=Francisella sciaenopsi TaxID=3055034 RepID=A0ABQ6PHS9_9GAMM
MNNLSPQDYQTIVYDWNRTDKDYPKDRTIYQLFEEQVGKNPNNVALVFPSTSSGQCEDKEFTCEQLNNRSNQLARCIRKQYKKVTGQELKADTLIPLCLEKSVDIVIAILAVMKAGGAYVPMDPEYPVERFRHILADTEAKLVITQSHIEQRLKEVRDIELISIDDQDNEIVYQSEDVSNLAQYSQSNDLAYVIYTSGTTGLPKGVVIEHRQISLKIITVINDFGISKKDVIGSKINYVFDPFAREVFVALVTGARLIVFSRDDVYDFDKLIENVYKYQITYLIFVASQLELFVDYVKRVDISKLSSLRLVFNCGERLPSKLAKDFYAVIDGTQLVNQYGPSECTQYTTHYLVNKFDEVIPIGKPNSNSKLYVLDKYKQPVSVGVVGELYIGGAGLARGYLNRPELTAERFVSNPFATESDMAKGYTRLYKTGDLVRWLSDGNIEYIGRNDDQIKIRGYRIELGEIEHQLSSIEGVRQSCVLAKDKNDSKYLVGYYVLDKETTLTQEEILNRLAKVLPEYMVPSILVELEGMPLTVNGKLDRRALPESDFVNEASYVAPVTELEISLSNIFAEVLGLEKVGITDNFFRIGGNSILAIKIVSKVNTAQLNFKFDVKDIFYYQSISNLINRRLTDIEKGQLSSLTFRKGKYAYEYWDHRPRIMDYEHLTQSEQREFYNILSQMSRDVDQMMDIIGTAKGCILVCNEAGNKPPIFWVCNNWTEFSNLAKIIGDDQPLYGMRSLHTYAKDSDKYRKFQERLCLYYFNQISQLCNVYEPFVVFGNCQSGMFAESIVVHFKRILDVSPYLATLEYFPKAYDGKALLLYGYESKLNPFVNSDKDPIPMWDKIFERYEYKILPAKHGQFFKEPCIIDTSSYLSSAIDLINDS